jgi:hypothetical protein
MVGSAMGGASGRRKGMIIHVAFRQPHALEGVICDFWCYTKPDGGEATKAFCNTPPCKQRALPHTGPADLGTCAGTGVVGETQQQKCA